MQHFGSFENLEMILSSTIVPRRLRNWLRKLKFYLDNEV